MAYHTLCIILLYLPPTPSFPQMQLYIENITKSGEEKLERLWQEYQDVLAGYMRHTESFYSEYMDLKERDQESANIIRDHYHQIERASDQLAHLKLVYADSLENNEVKVIYFVKLRDDLQQRLSESKANFESELKTDEQRFKLMSVVSYNVLKVRGRNFVFMILGFKIKSV